MISIQDELIAKYGDEAGAINNISAAIRGEVDALDAVAVAAAQNWLNEKSGAGIEAQKFITETFDSRFTQSIKTSKDNANKLKSDLDNFFNYIGISSNTKTIDSIYNGYSVNIDFQFDDKTRTELIEEYSRIIEELQTYKSLHPEVDFDDFEKQLNDKYNKINDTNYQNQKTTYEQYGKNLAMTTATYQETYGKVLKLQSDYEEVMATEDGESKNNKLNQIFQDVESLREEVDGIDNVAVKDYLSGVITDFKTLSNMDKVQLGLELNTNGIQDSVKNIVGKLTDKNGNLLTDKGILSLDLLLGKNGMQNIPGVGIVLNTQDVTKEQAEAISALRIQADNANMSLEEYINTLVKLGLVTQEVEPTPDFNISEYKERINNIVLYKPAQIGKTPEMDNPEGKSCMLN